MKNVVITGANRGIGLGFVRHYLNRGDQVWACAREASPALLDLNSERLNIVTCDVSQDLAEEWAENAGIPDEVHVLVNNAGIYGPKRNEGQTLTEVSSGAMLEVFNVNSVGPLRTVQALRTRVIAGKGTIANVSSKMGSSDDNTSGGCYAYRASKAALVIMSKSMAIDLEEYGVKVATLHPGWVRTDMTSHNGLIDVEQSVAGMTTVIEKIDDYPLGSFIAFDGKVIPF